MAVYTVCYYTPDQPHGQLQIEADTMADLYEILDHTYGSFEIEEIFLEEEEIDGEPTEHDEWMSYDPDC
jgi:hypothetical protein